MALEIRQFPCLQDNYGFLVRCSETGEVAVIDTPEAEVILEEAQTLGWPISAIWNTHHHWDHAGGNAAIAKATGAQIIAPRAEQATIGHVDQPVSPGDTVMLGDERAQVIDVGGHTLGHVAYWFEDAGVAFVGDSLFALGCGRMFEGTPEQMQAGLARLRSLPPETVIYCAHEYTQANARFALSIDPDNQALQSYARRVDALRADDQPTIPTVLAAECEANPFLRWDDEGLRARLGLQTASDAQVFAELRRRKDTF
ncbi:MAG: hydroxyacylglutathione hydrolase [Oceanicaulis sp.]|uniref:hydroxyacylglutathione hydrolase n=1 Tax=Oceanicaulis sp. UBA2681 TaxID=1947007 RepID=UPI000C0A16A3|nr:hydroxyacylglutathione hydrolase [Oceanicaulis sp. UBA2681]MAP49710.1 hydroxyacylglutathione hydrolase [Oceanicaulis sp.]MBL4538851.1 hydroxyacylglutathione hydrolase [Oceanicaulis sp.]HCR66099.1 hydroxyacylglutathione hydrolase [Oceanicaulis sp.]